MRADAAAEPVEPGSRLAEDPRVDGHLVDALTWWAGEAARELLPRPRLWFAFGCRQCRSLRDATFRHPEAHPRQLRDRHAIDAWLDEVPSDRTPGDIDAADWSSAHRCPCGAPTHHVEVLGWALLYSDLGAGVGWAFGRLGSERKTYRIPMGGARPTHYREAEPPPVSLFDEWEALLGAGPAKSPAAHVREVEAGVALLVAASREDAERVLDLRFGTVPRFGSFPALETIRGWSEPLRAAREARPPEEAWALVVSHQAIVEQARSLARARLGLDAHGAGDATHFDLVGEGWRWPVATAPIVDRMARDGVGLAASVAIALEEAIEAFEGVNEILRRMTELVEGASFRLEGPMAVGLRRDGSEIRRVDPRLLLQADLTGDALLRTARFLLQDPPPWADPTRACPCGAPATVQRTLVAWPWCGPSENAPLPLTRFDPAGAAEVVVLACDQHRRIPSASESLRLGLDATSSVRRAQEDAGRAIHRFRILEWGEGYFLLRGPDLSGVVLEPRWLANLYRALPAAALSEEAIALALDTDIVLLVDRGAVEPSLDAVRTLLAAPWPFTVRRQVSSDVAPGGSFILETTGGD